MMEFKRVFVVVAALISALRSSLVSRGVRLNGAYGEYRGRGGGRGMDVFDTSTVQYRIRNNLGGLIRGKGRERRRLVNFGAVMSDNDDVE